MNQLEALVDKRQYDDARIDKKTEANKCTRQRVLAGRGEPVRVITVFPKAMTATIEIKEVKRKSRISEDIGTLVKVYDSIAGAPKSFGVGDDSLVDIKTHTLTEKRSTLTVDVKVKQGEKARITSNTSYLTGPAEHFFLSADLPVDEVKELKYDAENKTLVEREKPSKFYIGVNAMWGDVVSNDYNNWYDGLFLKAMLLADSDPLDSYGIGVGYRFKQFDAASFFVSYIVSKEDDIAADGSNLPNEGDNDEIRFGVSLNLDRALTWLK